MNSIKKQSNPYPLRMEDDVKAWLQQRAKANDRTLHAELNRILRTVREGDTTSDINENALLG